MPCEYLVDVARMAGYVGDQGAESTSVIHGLNPLSQKFALSSLFLRVLSFHLQHQHPAIG